MATRVAIPVQQNLLLRSEEMGNAAWNASVAITVTSDNGVAPDGTLTADLLTASGGVNRHYIAQAFTVPVAYQFSPRRVTVSCFAKQSGTTTWFAMGNERHTDFVYAWFDLTNGVVGSVSADSPTAINISSSIEIANPIVYPSAPAGWYRCMMTYLMVSPGGGAGMAAESLLLGPTSADAVQSYDSAGAGTPYATLAWGASMTIGANQPGPYAKTVAAQIDTGSLRSLP